MVIFLRVFEDLAVWSVVVIHSVFSLLDIQKSNSLSLVAFERSSGGGRLEWPAMMGCGQISVNQRVEIDGSAPKYMCPIWRVSKVRKHLGTKSIVNSASQK